MSRLTVERLRLGQFRSYALAEIETGGGAVALYGPNGAGKTNLLEAVSFLVAGRGLRRAAAEAVPRQGGPGWRLRAEVTGPGGAIEVVTGAEGGGGRTVEIDGKAAAQSALGRHIRQIWLTPAMDRLWTDPAADRRRFLDRMTLGFVPDHGAASADYERAMRERNRLLKEGTASGAWLDGLEAQMARLGARIARARASALAAIEAAPSLSETVFPAAELTIQGDMEAAFAAAIAAGEDLEALEAVEAAGFDRALGQGRGQDMAAGRTLRGPHRSDLEAVYTAKSMPARLCSTGEQKALLISLCLANARALAAHAGAPPILLLDEVAAHLDAERRVALYGEIAGIGAQAWMTGTGPELFEGLLAAHRFAVSEGAGGTVLTEARDG